MEYYCMQSFNFSLSLPYQIKDTPHGSNTHSYLPEKSDCFRDDDLQSVLLQLGFSLQHKHNKQLVYNASPQLDTLAVVIVVLEAC